MKSRIEHLTRLIQKENQIIEDAKNGLIPDPWRVNEAISIVNRLGAERTWLLGILDCLTLPIISDSWNADDGPGRIYIQIQIAEQRIISPLNSMIYAPDSPQEATMDFIHVKSLSYGFGYVLDVLDMQAPAQMIAEQIRRNYIRSVPELDNMILAVDFANKALSYLERRLEHDPMPSDEIYDLRSLSVPFREHEMSVHNGAVWPESLPEPEFIIQKAVNNDNLLGRLSQSVGENWPMTRKLIAHALKNQQYRIDWQPFEKQGEQ